MARKKKELTDEERYQLQLQEEFDLSRYMRQYDVLSKSYGHSDKMSTMIRQNGVLNILRHEETNVLTDLAVATTQEKVRGDNETLAYLSELLEEYNRFNYLLKFKKSQLNEIVEQIRQMQKKTNELTKKDLTEKQQQDQVFENRKTLEALENKLDVQIKQFCAICTTNKKLRMEIDHLLNERKEFFKIWENLIKNLNMGKRFLMDLIEQATLAYDQREEWVSKLQFLRQKACKDLFMHTSEMIILQRKLDENMKLRDFMIVKGQKRIMRDLEAKEREKRDALRERLEKEVAEYEAIIKNVQTFMNEVDMYEIVKKFLIQENENFSMFKYTNELGKEIEHLNDCLCEIHLEIDEQKALHNLRIEEQERKLENLREQVEVAKQEADDSEDQVKHIDGNLGTIMSGIEKLFAAFQCKRDPILKLLGDNTKVNGYNILLHLQTLESKILDAMLNIYYTEEQQHENRKISSKNMTIQPTSYVPEIYTIDQIVGTDPCPLCVEHELVSDVIDDLQYVLNKSQIQESLAERLILEDGLDRIHTVSACHLPKSREIIQKRYQ